MVYPPRIFEALALSFDLDPCAPAGGLPWIPAKRFYSLADDGLAQPWHGRVWLNPPYGDETPLWLDRLADHGDGIALVFARTDTKWFHRVAPRATAICFLSGRITFLRGDGQDAPDSGIAPSLLLAFGLECAAALRHSRLGWMTVGILDS